MPTSRGTDHKKSQVLENNGTPDFEPRGVHFRLAAAYEEALQDGQNPTDAVIAKKLNVRRETITRWRRRNRPMMMWLYREIGEHAAALRPLVDRRVTQLALSGSPEHTKLFYQFVAKVVPFVDDPTMAAQAPMVLNLLVPRPDLPGLPAPAASAPVKNITTIVSGVR